MASIEEGHEDEEILRVKSRVNDALTTQFPKFVDKVKVEITFDSVFRGLCEFYDVPEEEKVHIDETVHRVLDEVNMEFFTEHRQSNPQFKPWTEPTALYDVIILLYVHGVPTLKNVSVCSDTQVQECVLAKLPEDTSVTFLQASSCGVTNYTYNDWHASTRSKVDRVIRNLGSTRALAEVLQTMLRADKLEFIATTEMDRFMETEPTKALAFKREPGWDLVTSNKHYVDRNYSIDPEWISMVVVYSDIKQIPVDTNLKTHIPMSPTGFNRTELLTYLFEQGARHPLIIDNSCAGVVGTPTAQRYVVRSLPAGVKGGKICKSRKNKHVKRYNTLCKLKRSLVLQKRRQSRNVKIRHNRK
jgi:hypothetical protein